MLAEKEPESCVAEVVAAERVSARDDAMARAEGVSDDVVRVVVLVFLASLALRAASSRAMRCCSAAMMRSSSRSRAWACFF